MSLGSANPSHPPGVEGVPVKLVAVTVQKFRNFVQPQRIEIEDDVTVHRQERVGKRRSSRLCIA